MTPAMEGAALDPQESVDHLAQKVTPSLAHQALRGHRDIQGEAIMGHLDHQVHLDLQDHS